MNKNYETVFIINPVLSEKQVEDTVKKYKKILDTGKVKTVCDESLGFKELAYPINNKNSGFFHLFQYETEKISRKNAVLAFYCAFYGQNPLFSLKLRYLKNNVFE